MSKQKKNIPSKFTKKQAEIRGYLKKTENGIVINADFSAQMGGGGSGAFYEVPLEEVMEDFEDNDAVRIKIISDNQFVQSTVDELKRDQAWNAEIFDALHPDYTYASEEAREKFLDHKFGMMIHWGIYSQLGIPESWPANANRCDPEFLDVYYTMWEVFNPVEFNADEWAQLAQRAGMQFFQFTTKHHDGYCLYDTKTKTWARKRVSDQGPGVGGVEDVYINFSVMDSPIKKDIVGELVEAFRKRDLGIGFYYSHIDWNDPNFRWDRANRVFDPNYNPNTYPEQWQAFMDREQEQLREIFTNYGEIDQMFFDGSWFGIENEKMMEMTLMIRKLQPNCMFSDRGLGNYGDFTSPERWIPKSSDDKRVKGKIWQVCDPIHGSWAYLPNDPYKENDKLLHNFIEAVAKGGTYVFAISPMATGRFPQKTVDALKFMGDWLIINGEAIYETRAWDHNLVEDKDIFFTRSKDSKQIYVISFEKSQSQLEIAHIPNGDVKNVSLIGEENQILSYSNIEGSDTGILVNLNDNLIEKLKDEIAFSLKIQL